MIVIKRKISCILAMALTIGMLPLTVFASEEELVVPEDIQLLAECETIPEATEKEILVCQHEETAIQNIPVMGEKTHSVTELCICGTVLNESIQDCVDETEDGKCDACEQLLTLEEETDLKSETEQEPEAEPETLFGDVNEDGQITSEDATYILKYVVELVDEIDAVQADVDKDGMISAKDALLILRYCAGLTESLPA